MRGDLERLLISEVELLELTGFNRQQILPSRELTQRQIKIQCAIALGISAINFISFASIFLPPLRVAGIIFLISLTLGALSLAIEFVEVTVLFFCVALGAAIYSLYALTGATLGIVLLCLGLAIASGILALLLIRLIVQQWRKSKKSHRQKGIPPVILRLFIEVDKCNKTIRDIDVFDQLQDAGNPIKLESRESAIAALRMTRNDIVRALKTERILREHPDFHPDRFDIDLNAFEAIQINNRAKEYGRIFDTTVQIAIDVQKAMTELQESTSDFY
ncbi:cytochrome bd-type quinol oxidase, subunit 1 [Pseudanabaena sp. lw0831]|nr:cytochrome bd-type quinol oxidase, subunit 1 [Pseudanabaena sp. lw0831]